MKLIYSAGIILLLFLIPFTVLADVPPPGSERWRQREEMMQQKFVMRIRFSEEFFYSSSFNIKNDEDNNKISVGSEKLDAFFSKWGVFQIKAMYKPQSEPSSKRLRSFVLYLPSDKDIKQMDREIRSFKEIEWAAPEYFLFPMSIKSELKNNQN